MNEMSQNKMSGFAKVCFADAVFSSGSVVTLTVFSGPIAALLGDAIPQWTVFALGLGLIPWALFHFHLARRSVFSPDLARTSISGDAIWVAVSAALLIFDAHLFSTTGFAAIAGIALVVAIFGAEKFITSRMKPAQAAGH